MCQILFVAPRGASACCPTVGLSNSAARAACRNPGALDAMGKVLFDSEVSTESWRLFAVRFASQWVEQVERCIGGVLATSAGALHVALRSSGVGMSNVCGDVIERNARVA